MASTYSSLKIELITTGEQSGTWGATTNTNLGTALEEAIVGRATADFPSDANLTLTLTNTNATQVARNFVLNVTSSVSLSTTRDLIVPAIEKPYIIQNNTSGNQSIRVIVAGASVTVPNGRTAFVYNDGTDVKSAIDYIPSVSLGSALATSSGGTGITGFTAANNAIYSTSSSALTAGTLPVAAGGTGATSATAYAVQCGGTTSTGPHQSVVSVGTAGQVLTSNGAGALPTFQTSTGITTGKSIAMAMIFGF